MSAITFQLMPKAPDGTPKEGGIEYCSGGTVSNVEGVLVFPLMPVGMGECVDFKLAPWAVVDFAADPEVACTGAPVQFTNLSDYGESFLWDFGDGTTSTDENPVHTYSVGGFKRVELTVGNIAGEQTEGRNGAVEVKVQPVAAFSFAATNLTVSFSDASTGDVTAWAWDFGDGNTSAAQNPIHTYAAEGTYTVTLVVSGAPCAASTATQSVVLGEVQEPEPEWWYHYKGPTYWTAFNTDWISDYPCDEGYGYHRWPFEDCSFEISGTWAADWRPTWIQVGAKGHTAVELLYVTVRDVAGAVIAEGFTDRVAPEYGRLQFAWQGNDLGSIEVTSDKTGSYSFCINDIIIYGTAPPSGDTGLY